MFRLYSKIFGLTSFVGATAFSGHIYIKKSNPANRLDIIFDLDETLISSEKQKYLVNQNMANVRMHDSEHPNYKIWRRPFANQVLWGLSKFNNVHMFTRATQDYADKICHDLKFDKYFVSKKYREDCSECKDVTKFCFDVKRTILVDNDSRNQCIGHQMYHIPLYNHHAVYDFELLKLFWFVLMY